MDGQRSILQASEFECRVSVHIPKDERFKLDDKAKQCIFVGYAHEEFGYRLWDLIDKKIIQSRDVIFLEDQTMKTLTNRRNLKSPMKFLWISSLLSRCMVIEGEMRMASLLMLLTIKFLLVTKNKKCTWSKRHISHRGDTLPVSMCFSLTGEN